MEQLLSKLKSIQPDEEFKARSRSLILNSPQAHVAPKILDRFMHSLEFGAAFSLAAVFIFLILGGLSTLNKKVLSPALLSGVDPEGINNELEKIDFHIQLSQAKYYEDSAEKIEVALTKASNGSSVTSNEEINRLLEELSL